MSYSIESFHFFYYYRYFLFHFIIIENTNWKIHLEKPILFIENKYEYYGIAKDTYYTLGYVKESEIGKTINYTVKLDKVPNNKYYFIDVCSYLNFMQHSK